MSSKRSKKRASRDGGGSGEGKRRIEGWECPICTFDNKLESFKCAMCDTRKGTSTRKPRLSTTIQEQHQTVHNFVLQQQAEAAAKARAARDASRGRTTSPCPSTSSSLPSPLNPSSPSLNTTPSPSASLPSQHHPLAGALAKSKTRPKAARSGPAPAAAALPGLDRNSARTHAVTVAGVTVVITDYKLKSPTPTNNNQTSPAKTTATTPVKTPERKTEEKEKEEALLSAIAAPLTPPVLSQPLPEPPAS